MADKDYIGVLTVLRDQIASGFVNIAPRKEVDEPHREPWKEMFVESLNAGIDAIEKKAERRNGWIRNRP